MRTILIVCLATLLSSARYAKEEERELVIVGFLYETYPKDWRYPSEYVLEDGYLYKGASHHIGQTYAHLGSVNVPANLLNKTVIAYGTLDKDLNQILVKGEKAPDNYGEEERGEPMQARSDWFAPETGFSIGRSTKRQLESVEFFRVKKVEEFKGFTVTKNDKSIEVSFTNTFDQDLQSVEIVAHYEPTFVKPTAKYETHFSGPITKGQTITKTIPIVIDPTSEKGYEFRHVLIKGGHKNMRIMIESGMPK